MPSLRGLCQIPVALSAAIFLLAAACRLYAELPAPSSFFPANPHHRAEASTVWTSSREPPVADKSDLNSNMAGTMQLQEHLTADATLKLNVIEIPPPSGVHKSTVFLIHGLGDSADGVRELAEALSKSKPGSNSDAFANTKWVLPSAPLREITRNRGAVMPGWYDNKELGTDAPASFLGIADSIAQLTALLRAEVDTHHIPAENIVLGGFSQGGTISLLMGLTLQKGELGGGRLGGVYVLSGRLILGEYATNNLVQHAKEIPMFLGHGTKDEMVPFSSFQNTITRLQEFGFSINKEDGLVQSKVQGYMGMEHEVNLEVFGDLKKWLEGVLAKMA